MHYRIASQALYHIRRQGRGPSGRAPDDVRIVELPLPARRQFAVVGTLATMRSPAIEVVTGFLRDQRLPAKTKAYRAGIISFD